MAPILRALAIMTLCFSAIAWPVLHSRTWSLTSSAAVAVATLIALSVASYFTFGLRELQTLIGMRLRRFAG